METMTTPQRLVLSLIIKSGGMNAVEMKDQLDRRSYNIGIHDAYHLLAVEIMEKGWVRSHCIALDDIGGPYETQFMITASGKAAYDAHFKKPAL